MKLKTGLNRGIVSPYKVLWARKEIGRLEVRIKRDLKELYAKALRGEIKDWWVMMVNTKNQKIPIDFGY